MANSFFEIILRHGVVGSSISPWFFEHTNRIKTQCLFYLIKQTLDFFMTLIKYKYLINNILYMNINVEEHIYT